MKNILKIIMIIIMMTTIIFLSFSGCTMDNDRTLEDVSQMNDEKLGEDMQNGSEQSYSKDLSDGNMNQDINVPSDGVVIALLDTGVSSNAITSDNLLAGYNYVNESADTEDMINHGTAIASIILGCESAGVKAESPDAYIVPIVVVTKEAGKVKSVSTEVLAKAIRDSVDIYNADIINVSLGVQKNSPELEEAVQYAEKEGVLVVSAVGNDGAYGKPYYPAAYTCVMAVGACDEHGKESDFSQAGADVLAMGEDIWLASRNGMTYGARGTSYSTGFVSATAAELLLNNKELSLQELREEIIAVYE